MADKIKFALALLLVAAGVAGFYLLGEAALILRVLSVLAGVITGAAVAWFTLRIYFAAATAEDWDRLQT
mgnify:CR=1 FL=1